MAALIPWLAPVLTVGFVVMLGLALLLWQDMRRSERLSARLRMVRSGGGPAEPEPGTGLSPVLGFVTAIGEAIARSGALSARTLEELRQTLHVAGFRGDHGLGLFVGTKLLLVIGLPLPVLIAVWLLHLNVPYPTAVAAVAAGVVAVMPAFTDLAGIPMTVHMGLLRHYLRDQLGFDGGDGDFHGRHLDQ